jgi:phosphatidylglycerophosphatase GEP4
MAYFKAHPDSGVTRPDQIAIVGDRLSTDIMMANLMGGYGVWVRDGVQGRGFVSASTRGRIYEERLRDVASQITNANRITVRENGRQAAGLSVSKRLCCT